MKKRIFDYRHIINVVITAGIGGGLGYYFRASFLRLFEGVKDFGLCVAFYFCELFGIKHSLPIAINALSPYLDPLPLRFDLSAVFAHAGDFFRSFFNGATFVEYLGSMNKAARMLAYVLTFVLPVFILVYILVEKQKKLVNNDFAKESKALKKAKRFGEKVYMPVKAWVLDYWDFTVAKKYLRIWLIELAFIFNGVTILFEFIAWYFYFVASFDFGSIFTQVYKLFIDLAPTVRFIPKLVWIIIGLKIFDVIRKKIGYQVLEHNELKNRGFINERPIIAFVCGSMGSGKTTKIVDMALSQEVMFRDQALEILIEIDLKYPKFPWISFENALKRLIDNHVIYNLASIDSFMDSFKSLVLKVLSCDSSVKRSFSRKYKRLFSSRILTDETFFGYEYKKYGLETYDGLKVASLIDELKDYAKAYFVYLVQSVYLIGNLSVRVNDQFLSNGNFPLWQNDFFKMPISAPSRFAHVLDYDALRLGRKMIEDNKENNYFEFGVVMITEIGKERLNALELREVKKLLDETNQKNDRFNDYLKMIRHGALIANRCFVKVFTDEQRPDSWGADARDLCEIITVESNGKPKLALPFFWLEKAIYDVFYPKFVSWYVDFRFRRGDYTLPFYVRKNIFARFYNYYQRINNVFGYYKCSVDIENGARTNEPQHNYYYISKKKIYSDRFRSDCFADFFFKKSLSSETSLDEVKTFDSILPEIDELKLMNSYFYNQLSILVDSSKNDIEG